MLRFQKIGWMDLPGGSDPDGRETTVPERLQRVQERVLRHASLSPIKRATLAEFIPDNQSHETLWAQLASGAKVKDSRRRAE